MFNTRTLCMVLAGCLLLAVLIPLQQSLAAPRTVLMELFDSEY